MADKKDYYESLGVSKTATDAEIKSAFRKLAKKYHPDNKETGDEAKFKEIGEAYSVLSDKQKRAQYDQFGHAAFQNGGAGGFGGGQGFSGFGFDDIDLSDLFNMFGGGFGGSSRSSSRGSAKTKGRDIETNIEISFEDSVYGCEKILKVSLDELCSECSGKGGKGEKTCPTCSGRGRVISQQRTMFGVFQTETVCPDCQGRGVTYESTCSVCRGKGIVEKLKEIKLRVPRGVETGDTLRLSGKGNAGPNGGARGDIYINFRVKEHEIFKRDGRDIYVDIPLTLTEAILGCEKEVPTIHGTIVTKIPAGTQNLEKFRFKGKGVDDEKTGRLGDEYGIVKVIIPDKLTKEQKDLIKKLSETTLDNSREFKTYYKYTK